MDENLFERPDKEANSSLHLHTFLAGFFIIIILTAFDQFTKYLAVINLKNHSAFVLISKVLSLRYLENRGVGFGLFQGRLSAILILNFIILVIICFVLIRTAGKPRMFPISITLLFTVAGALGNIIDRLRLGYVVDFISFDLINFPVFNVSDIYVTVSIFLFAVLYLFYCRPGELEGLILNKKK